MKTLAQQFDHHLTALIQRLPGSIMQPMVIASFLGLPVVVVITGITFFILAISSGQTKLALSMAAALAAFGSLALLKLVLRRARPDTPYVQKYQLIDFSFPSGHTSGSLLVYGLLSYLSYHHLGSPLSLIVSASLALLAIMIGLSRVYLGAHYPTDVLGAWTLSGIYLAAITRLLHP